MTDFKSKLPPSASLSEVQAEFQAWLRESAKPTKLTVPHAGITFREGRELKSDAASVHPSRIAEATQMLKEAGCPTRYDREGRPCFRSLRHREQFVRVTGLTLRQ
jgi:hypothetical protein